MGLWVGSVILLKLHKWELLWVSKLRKVILQVLLIPGIKKKGFSAAVCLSYKENCSKCAAPLFCWAQGECKIRREKKKGSCKDLHLNWKHLYIPRAGQFGIQFTYKPYIWYFSYSTSALIFVLGEFQGNRRCVWHWESCMLTCAVPLWALVGFTDSRSQQKSLTSHRNKSCACHSGRHCK